MVGSMSYMPLDWVQSKVVVVELSRWMGHLYLTVVDPNQVTMFQLGRGDPVAVIVQCVLVLCLCECCPCLLKPSYHAILELIHRLYMRPWLLQLKAHVGVLASIYHEWGLLRLRVNVVVVCKLTQGEELIPVVLALVHKEM
jgi:hypothetical protein